MSAGSRVQQRAVGGAALRRERLGLLVVHRRRGRSGRTPRAPASATATAGAGSGPQVPGVEVGEPFEDGELRAELDGDPCAAG